MMTRWGEIKCPRCEELSNCVAVLEAERDALAEAIDSEHSQHGNIWRFWRDIADKAVANRKAAEAERDALAEENKRLIEALTPSGDTKAEYAGEFHISVYDGEDEDGNEIWRKVPVEWTTIKAIMAAIKARATLAELTGGKDD